MFEMNASTNGTSAAITPAHVRAARGLLGWTQTELIDRSGVPKRTLIRFELGEGAPQPRTVAALQAALEAAGVTFTNGDEPGVKLRKPAE